jgi:tetratricopeptide (TPR) repeat protein
MAQKYKWRNAADDAYVYFKIADIYTRIGDNTKALLYYEKSLQTRSELQDKERLVACKTNIANCLSDAGKYELAINAVKLPDSLSGVSRKENP